MYRQNRAGRGGEIAMGLTQEEREIRRGERFARDRKREEIRALRIASQRAEFLARRERRALRRLRAGTLPDQVWPLRRHP
jgi:hypothetical protein